MTATTEERQTLTLDEIRALPAVCPAQDTVCAVWGISTATFFRLLGEDGLPVPTFTIGRSRRVYRADILRAIGEDTNDGAGAATPTPPAETHTTTSSDQ
ncbi:hypothetical protein ACIOC1_00240 [Streptomyces sp. NPDC088197]|uniref:hypothetical protein n=1 Tax=Streptomyces sp. NPDC088197 TaxID=3365840 RepID=UPI0038073637